MEQRIALSALSTQHVYKVAAQSSARLLPAHRVVHLLSRGTSSTPLAQDGLQTAQTDMRFSTRPLLRTVALPVDVDGATEPLATTRQLENASRRRKPWTAWRIVRWVGGMAILAVAGYVIWVLAALEHLKSTIYTPLPPTRTPNALIVLGTASALSAAGITVTPTADPYKDLPRGHIYILALGSDKRPDNVGLSPRSDSMILVNLDTQTRSVKMLTIPRDLAVEIPGYPGKQKINAAYFLGERDDGPGGGQSLAVETVSRVFNVPIDYYVMINFDGFRTLVDMLGGVDIDVPAPIDDAHYPGENPDDPFAEIQIHFDAGLQHMDGLHALRYARTRHADSDFGRSRRQLQIILAIKHKAASLDLLTKLPGVLDQLAGMLETDIPPGKQIPLLQAGYDLDPSHILTTTIGADLVTPIILSDRSQALSLNVKKAKPVLDKFFGRVPATTPTKSPITAPRKTPTVVPTAVHNNLTVVPTKTPVRTPVKKATVVTPQYIPGERRGYPRRGPGQTFP